MDTQATSSYMRSLSHFNGWVVQLIVVLFFLNLAYQLAKRRLETATGRDENFGDVLRHYTDMVTEGAISVQSQATTFRSASIATKDSVRGRLVSLIPPKPVTAPVGKPPPCRHGDLQEKIRQLQEQIHGHQDQLQQLRWALVQQEHDNQTRNTELEENLALELADLARFYEGVLTSQRHELQQAAAQDTAADKARIRALEDQVRQFEAPSVAEDEADGSSLLAALKEQMQQTRALQRALAAAPTGPPGEGDQRLAALGEQHAALLAERDRLDAARARAEDAASTAQAEGARRRLQTRRLRAACARLRAELRAEQERLGCTDLAELARDGVPMEGVSD